MANSDLIGILNCGLLFCIKNNNKKICLKLEL